MIHNKPNQPGPGPRPAPRSGPRPTLAPRLPAKYNQTAATDGYRRYRLYLLLLFFWMAIVAAYIFTLEYASRNHGFLGIRGTPERARNFEIITFLRTGLVIVHVPVITAVLASTIPHATMKKALREEYAHLRFRPHQPPLPSERTTLPQLFFLADRSWAGLVGWISLLVHGTRMRAFSITWLHLTVITAISYLGFPILSLAYGVTSSQYWTSEQLSATVSIGGLDLPYNVSVDQLLLSEHWMDGQLFNLPIDFGELAFFNSSDPREPQYYGRQQPFPFWANNSTLASLPVGENGTYGNAQLATVGVQVFAECGFNNYNATEYLPNWWANSGPVPDLAFDFREVDPATNYGLPYMLECKKNCSTTSLDSPYSCSALSSMLNITSSDSSGDGGYDIHNKSSPTFEGQVLSCIDQQYSALHTEASVQLARQGPGAWTQVADCKISIAYTAPIVNTLIGEYLESSSTATTLPVLDVDPEQFLDLSVASFLNFFHVGPVPSTDLPPITDDFNWVTYLPPDAGNLIIQLMNNDSFNPWDWYENPEIYAEKYGTQFEFGYIYPIGVIPGSDWGVTQFSENVFLAPLAYFLSNPVFFGTGPVTAVVFKTDLEVAHGRVPIIAAIFILFFPMLWTLLIVFVASAERRWTSTLDSFAMFRLGGDWTESMKDLQLASMSTAKKELMEISGTVLVDPETATVKLAYGLGPENGTEDAKIEEKGKQPAMSERDTLTEVSPL